jgi:hypothetical protein
VCADLPVQEIREWLTAKGRASAASTGAGCTIMARSTPVKAPRSSISIFPPPPSSAGVP